MKMKQVILSTVKRHECSETLAYGVFNVVKR
jgi:hypothetical protein